MGHVREGRERDNRTRPSAVWAQHKQLLLGDFHRQKGSRRCCELAQPSLVAARATMTRTTSDPQAVQTSRGTVQYQGAPHFDHQRRPNNQRVDRRACQSPKTFSGTCHTTSRMAEQLVAVLRLGHASTHFDYQWRPTTMANDEQRVDRRTCQSTRYRGETPPRHPTHR